MKASADTPKIRAYWKPNGDINRKNATRLKAWMKEHCLDGGDITYFLYAKIFKDARRKAVLDLGIGQKSPFNSIEIAELRAYWKPKGKAHSRNEQEIFRVIKLVGSNATCISDFLYNSKYKSHHRRALKALGLK
jgi:hypothetical protein